MGFSRRIVLLVVAVLVLAGAGIAAGILITRGGSSGGSTAKARYRYPASVKSQIASACMNHSQKSVCDCVVRAYEATIPYGIYEDIARGGIRANNRAYYQAFTTVASHCSP